MQVGWVKIGDFRQIAGYISKTIQDRRMVSIEVECVLSNGDIAHDLECPLTTRNHAGVAIQANYDYINKEVNNKENKCINNKK